MTPKRYVVRDGCVFGANSQYGPGDIVELEPSAAVGFKDLLSPLRGEAVSDEPKPKKEASSGKSKGGKKSTAGPSENVPPEE